VHVERKDRWKYTRKRNDKEKKNVKKKGAK
jgi:hypothetical protein